MAYIDINTGKEALMREIATISKRIKRPVNFDPAWMTNYEDLVDLKHEMEQRGEHHARKLSRKD